MVSPSNDDEHAGVEVVYRCLGEEPGHEHEIVLVVESAFGTDGAFRLEHALSAAECRRLAVGLLRAAALLEPPTPEEPPVVH
jgi:hypothetical protein